ncbi:hypothetical protein ASE04_28575 [Rhizobium sp. Root708]|nr:hypothetical protein ASE04_28575 [Rhizobium sp. Root708]
MFRVIEGGRASSTPIEKPTDIATLVMQEGNRRLTKAGVEHYVARQLVTGIKIPDRIMAFKLQMDFAIEVLASLSPLPSDYASDGYWPSMEDRAAHIGRPALHVKQP